MSAHTTQDMRDAVSKAVATVLKQQRAHDALQEADANERSVADELVALREAAAESRKVLKRADVTIEDARGKMAAAASAVQQAVGSVRKEAF